MGLSQVSEKGLGWGLGRGRGRDWIGWSTQGLGWGLNLGERREQALAEALVRAWPEPWSVQDQGLSLERAVRGRGLNLVQGRDWVGTNSGARAWTGPGNEPG